jgi:hypothetical protein
MQSGDIFVYYSPTFVFGEKHPCQCFTALGVIKDKPVYQVDMGDGFKPYRRDIDYMEVVDAPIKPLIPELEFIKSKAHWGQAFRFGLLQIGYNDLVRIAQALRVRGERLNEILI